MRKRSKKAIKARNHVARHNRCRGGFHSPSKYSRKTKYKTEDNSWKVEESKKFTVAPAYNKGAYQVIPRGDVEWIGK